MPGCHAFISPGFATKRKFSVANNRGSLVFYARRDTKPIYLFLIDAGKQIRSLHSCIRTDGLNHCHLLLTPRREQHGVSRADAGTGAGRKYVQYFNFQSITARALCGGRYKVGPWS